MPFTKYMMLLHNATRGGPVTVNLKFVLVVSEICECVHLTHRTPPI